MSGETLLAVDDNPDNVRGARDAGLLAIHFTTPGQLRADLAVFNALTATSPTVG